MTESVATSLGIGQVELEIPVEAPRERVWKAFVEEIGQWWLKDFYAGPNAQAFVLEPRLGGRMYEDWGDGAGLLWYTVIGIDPPRSLDLAGHLTPAFGGPAKTYLRIAFEEDGGRTRLKISDSIFGRVTPASAEQFRAGWEMLFGQGLKAWVEKA
jgi:uncharacterized protein YndB with AHSA1/START domain